MQDHFKNFDAQFEKNWKRFELIWDLGWKFGFPAFLLLVVLGNTMGVNYDPGEGKIIVGQLHKFGPEGLTRASTTWEAEFRRGSLTDGSGAFGGTTRLTVPSELVGRVENYLSGRYAKAVYKTQLVYWKFKSASGGNFLTAIEPIEPPRK